MYKRLKELRNRQGLKQKEVADILQTTYQYYSAYERGIKDIPFERVIMLATYYNVSTDYIGELTDRKERY